MPKDRLQLLRDLHAQLSGMQLRLYFRIGLTGKEPVEPEQAPGWHITHEWLGYAEYLNLVAQSRCLLDLYQAVQTGFSLRVMEHIFFSKKLLTNNRVIHNAEFYHPNNIFVLGRDDLREFKQWLALPFRPIDENIRQYYSFEEWIGRFEV